MKIIHSPVALASPSFLALDTPLLHLFITENLEFI